MFYNILLCVIAEKRQIKFFYKKVDGYLNIVVLVMNMFLLYYAL